MYTVPLMPRLIIFATTLNTYTYKIVGCMTIGNKKKLFCIILFKYFIVFFYVRKGDVKWIEISSTILMDCSLEYENYIKPLAYGVCTS